MAEMTLAARLTSVLSSGEYSLSNSAVFNQGSNVPTTGEKRLVPGEQGVTVQTYEITQKDGSVKKIASVGYLCTDGTILTATVLFPKFGTYIPAGEQTPGAAGTTKRVPTADLLKRTTFKKGLSTYGKPMPQDLGAIGVKPIFIFSKQALVKFSGGNAYVSVFDTAADGEINVTLQSDYGLIEVE